jgi:transposase
LYCLFSVLRVSGFGRAPACETCYPVEGHFQWPITDSGRVCLTPAQLSMLLEGIDWRMPARVRRPELAG